MKQSIGRLFLKIFSVTLFLAVAAVAVFFAYGYRLDFLGGSFRKTSIIDITGPKTQAQVYLDGEEVGGSLPVQLKNVLPGAHDLMVRKEGFVVWSRNIEVREDLVSIVRDVFLVPRDIENFISEVFVFGDEDTINAGNGYLLVSRPETNVLRAFLFHDRGEVKEEEIQLYKGGFQVLQSFSDDRFLLRFEDRTYAFVNFADRQFELFNLPPGARDVRVDVEGRRLYFLDDATLFMAAFDSPDTYESVHGSIEAYVVTSDGGLFFLSMGMLYRLQRDAGEPALLDQSPGHASAVRYVDGEGDGVMVLTDQDGVNMLFRLDESGDLVSVADGIVGDPMVDDMGRILYVRGGEGLYLYDAHLEETRFIRPLEENIQLLVLGWFDDVGHYLFIRGGELSVADVYNANEVLLLKETVPEFVYTEGGAFFWLEGRRLMRMYWGEQL